MGDGTPGGGEYAQCRYPYFWQHQSWCSGHQSQYPQHSWCTIWKVYDRRGENGEKKKKSDGWEDGERSEEESVKEIERAREQTEGRICRQPRVAEAWRVKFTTKPETGGGFTKRVECRARVQNQTARRRCSGQTVKKIFLFSYLLSFFCRPSNVLAPSRQNPTAFRGAYR